jgi:WD40 repeat protein
MPMCSKFINRHELLVAFEDGSVSIFNLQTSSRNFHCRIQSDPVLCLHLCGTSLFISHASNCIAKLSLGSWMETRAAVSNPGVSALCCSGDSKYLVSGGWDAKYFLCSNRLRLFSCDTLELLGIMPLHHSETVTDLVCTQKGSFLSASKDKTICLFKL